MIAADRAGDDELRDRHGGRGRGRLLHVEAADAAALAFAKRSPS